MSEQSRRPFPKWHQSPVDPESQCLVDGEVKDGNIVNGPGIIAYLDDFDNAAYPCAINALTGNWERGGPTQDRVEAMQWCERVAGLHPLKPGDGRPAFYYSADCQRMEYKDGHPRCIRCKHMFRHGADYDRPACCLDMQRPGSD